MRIAHYTWVEHLCIANRVVVARRCVFRLRHGIAWSQDQYIVVEVVEANKRKRRRIRYKIPLPIHHGIRRNNPLESIREHLVRRLW